MVSYSFYFFEQYSNLEMRTVDHCNILTDSYLLIDDRKKGFVNVKHVIVLYANAMECIHIYHSCLIRTKQFTLIYIILIK